MLDDYGLTPDSTAGLIVQVASGLQLCRHSTFTDLSLLPSYSFHLAAVSSLHPSFCLVFSSSQVFYSCSNKVASIKLQVSCSCKHHSLITGYHRSTAIILQS